MIKKCTLLVNTCDSYSDCWDGFFQLLQIQWPNMNMPVVLNTEEKEYSFPNIQITTMQLDKKHKMAWGKRLKETLKRIDTEYILFMLEDFYLTDVVDEQELNRCFSYMEENPNISYFSFLPIDEDQIEDRPSEKYPGYNLRAKKGAYRLNCQAALWRREHLLSYIRKHESPWEWELYGSRRSARYNREFYSIQKEEKRPFLYDHGEIIMRGRWYLKRVEPLIKKYNLNVDITKRGSYEEYVQKPSKRKRNIIRGIKNRIHKILSLI